MKVVLDTSLFATPDTVALDALAHLALTNWHRIMFEDESSPAVEQWLSALAPAHREQWTELIRSGYVLETREPARYTMRVTGSTPTDWSLDPPVALLGDALSFLRRPFGAMLEDVVSDKHFLLKMATGEQREALLRSEQSGLLAFVHGGGISSMPRVIDSWLGEGAHGHLRRWVLFDSDALRPSEPSDQSEILRSKCSEAGVDYYQLSRRNIENYLPVFALRDWAYNSRDRRRRERAFLAFVALSKDQRNHYNMKEGLKGDRGRKGKTAGDLFVSVSEDDQAALESGFGKSIGEAFSTEIVREEHLKRDGGWNELNPVVTDLIALLR